ncbi:MAG: hypothetical protein ACTSP6_12700 [Promethearchaeota archaeon]
MILIIFQNGTESNEGLFFFFPFMFVLALILLKIGLVITKAETRTGIKWVLISFGIQVGVFFFVAGPLMLAGFSETDGGGPPAILIILFVIIALFMDVNVLNITHELGLKRALIVFIFIFIPFAFVVGFIIFIISNF